jgi:hypothetical protein
MLVDIMLLQTVSIGIASASIVIAVVYYILQIQHQRRMREIEIETRQAQLFMDVFNHFITKEMMRDENEVLFQWKWEDFKDFWEKYGPETNNEAFSKWDSVETYIKGVGVLVKRKLIDPDLVKDLMGTGIILHWEKFGSVIKEIRRRYWPHAYEWYEDLYNEMKKREQAGDRNG